jgi:hypothetical protein
LTGVLLVGQGTVGTFRKPQQVTTPFVEEWDYDEWFDFDTELPDTEPNPLRDLLPLTDWPSVEPRPIPEPTTTESPTIELIPTQDHPPLMVEQAENEE